MLVNKTNIGVFEILKVLSAKRGIPTNAEKKSKINKMNKIISLIFCVILYSYAFAQAKPSFTIVGQVEKINTFKDSLTKSDREIYTKCKKWTLSKLEIKTLFKRRIKITSEQKQSEYYQLPCYYKGVIQFGKSKYTFELNAASFLTLYNDNEILYFSFRLPNAKKYFILSPIN